MLRTLFALLALATAASAQAAATVGPPKAPVGCPITITVSNDGTAGDVVTGVCPYRVFDEIGQPVYTPICILIAILLQPGQTFTAEWEQIDDLGNPVPPGIYRIDVMLEGGVVEQHFVEVANVDAALSMLGTSKLGFERDLKLCSPQDPFGIYAAAASLSTAGIPTCAGTVPLATDALFKVSQQASNGVFLSFAGQLDASGASTQPRVAFPADPVFQGIEFNVAFVVLDLSDPCPVARISEELPVKVE